LKAPVPDGLLSVFYKTFWDVVGVWLTREVMEVLKGGQIPASWNETTIARVLKEKYFANSSVLDAMPKSNMSYT